MMPEAAVTTITPQPDVRLELDLEGIIQDVTLSAEFPDQDLSDWIGKPWVETVVDPGSAKVRRIVEDARSTGVSAFRQVNQRFPSGLELPIEYTAVRLGRKGLVAVGKSLQAVAELQSRLNAAQQAIERDYWKLREVETRCRLLFDRSNEAVLMVRASGFEIVEANPAAVRALGLSTTQGQSPSGDLLSQVSREERVEMTAMLHRVRDEGRAPGILVHLGTTRQPWLVRASLLPSQEGLTYLLQLSAGELNASEERDGVVLHELIERSPDAFVAMDRSGTILHANAAFRELIQVGGGLRVEGERLERWLGRPGADMSVLLSNLARQGTVRLFGTELHSELGATTEVEVAASGDPSDPDQHLGLFIRDVSSRLPEPSDDSHLGSTLGAFTDRIGKTSLPRLVKDAVGVLERHYIDSALRQTGGNRTAAAQLLGVSRQGLYAKLNRYEIDEEDAPSRPPQKE